MVTKRKTKKAIILSLLEEQKQIPVYEVATLLYGNYSILEHIKVVNLLSAYRANDPKFKNIRVRNKHICYV